MDNTVTAPLAIMLRGALLFLVIMSRKKNLRQDKLTRIRLSMTTQGLGDHVPNAKTRTTVHYLSIYLWSISQLRTFVVLHTDMY